MPRSRPARSHGSTRGRTRPRIARGDRTHRSARWYRLRKSFDATARLFKIPVHIDALTQTPSHAGNWIVYDLARDQRAVAGLEFQHAACDQTEFFTQRLGY